MMTRRGNNSNTADFKTFTYKGYVVSFNFNISESPYSYILITIRKKDRVLKLHYPIHTAINLQEYAELMKEVYALIDFVCLNVEAEKKEYLEQSKEDISDSVLEVLGRMNITQNNNRNINYDEDVKPFDHWTEDDEKVENKKEDDVMSSSVSNWFNNTDTERYLK